MRRQQLKLDDEEQVQALINDVTSGAMRKRKSKYLVTKVAETELEKDWICMIPMMKPRLC